MSIREISAAEISAAVEQLVIDANYYLPEDVRAALEKAQQEEQSELCRGIIGDILKNADIAAQRQQPICQDTGLAIFFTQKPPNGTEQSLL